jgi:cytochrome c553
MRKMLRWILTGFAAVATLAVVAGVGGFAASEVLIRKPYSQPEMRIAAAADPGAAARGRRIATVAGCHDCHGDGFQGKLFHDDPAVVRVWAPNLTLAVGRQSDAQLERAIRHGVAADGRTLWIMPSESFSEFSDAEMADLLAYLRTFRPAGEAQPHFKVGPVGRLGVLLGKFDSAPALLRKEADLYRPDLGPAYARGRELSRACMECHGKDLKGRATTGAPDLEIAAAYSEADFERLLRTGVASGDRKLGLMSGIAPVRFNVLSHQEIADLHAYLTARADRGL